MSNLEELREELVNARRELTKAQEAGNEDAAYEWQQEVTQLAKEVTEASIERPFTAYEDQYGDYPL